MLVIGIHIAEIFRFLVLSYDESTEHDKLYVTDCKVAFFMMWTIKVFGLLLAFNPVMEA